MNQEQRIKQTLIAVNAATQEVMYDHKFVPSLARKLTAAQEQLLIMLMELDRGLEYDEVTNCFVAGEPDPEPELPEITPPNGRKVRTIDVSCPSCGAKPGKRCMRMTTRGQHGKPIPGTTAPSFHKARVSKMKAWN